MTRSARSRTFGSLLALPIVLAACGSEAAPREASATGGGEHGATMDRRTQMMGDEPLGMMCAMMSPDTQVMVQEIDGGAAIVLTAPSPDEVEVLRRHAEQMAGMQGFGGAGAGGGMVMPPASVTVADVPGGARIDLRARDPIDAGALRESVRDSTDQLSRECPMTGEATAMR